MFRVTFNLLSAMLSIWTRLKFCSLITLYELFTKRQDSRLIQIERICRQQKKCDSEIRICLGKGRKHGGKRRKCWLQAFSPFSTMFSKAVFLKVVKTLNYVVKG